MNSSKYTFDKLLQDILHTKGKLNNVTFSFFALTYSLKYVEEIDEVQRSQDWSSPLIFLKLQGEHGQ